MTREEELVGLMIAYQAGDASAFERLYAILANELQRHFARAHRDVTAASDLVQELFLEIHRSRRTYSPPLPVRPWVYGIARNVSARRRRAARNRADESSLDAAGEVSLPATVTSNAEALDVENALAALPASTRDPWLLHHAFGFSFDSIATRLGITVMAAKLRSSRATRALRATLKTSGKKTR